MIWFIVWTLVLILVLLSMNFVMKEAQYNYDRDSTIIICSTFIIGTLVMVVTSYFTIYLIR